MLRLPLLLLLGAALATGPVISQAATVSISPDRLVLKASDVPAALAPARAGYLTNQAEAADYRRSAATLARHGRRTGYFTFFDRARGVEPPSPGIWTVDDQVDAYQTEQGAHWGFALLIGLEKNGRPQTTIPPVGDEHWAQAVHWPSAPTQNVYVLIFRRGRYAVFLETVYRSAAGLQQTVKLAETLDARISAPPRSRRVKYG